MDIWLVDVLFTELLKNQQTENITSSSEGPQWGKNFTKEKKEFLAKTEGSRMVY